MVATDVSLAVLVAALAVADLVLVACMLSNRAAAVAMAGVRRPVGWVVSTGDLALATVVAVVRRA